MKFPHFFEYQGMRSSCKHQNRQLYQHMCNKNCLYVSSRSQLSPKHFVYSNRAYKISNTTRIFSVIGKQFIWNSSNKTFTLFKSTPREKKTVKNHPLLPSSSGTSSIVAIRRFHYLIRYFLFALAVITKWKSHFYLFYASSGSLRLRNLIQPRTHIRWHFSARYCWEKKLVKRNFLNLCQR